jgi:fatty-acid desaturase
LAAIVWLIAWLILHRLWSHRSVKFRKIFTLTLILIILGMMGAFPPLFEAFFEAYE